ncbi:MAG: hypothetical protein ACP5I4_00895 [Oceanipulchritudo sp.]
MNNPERAAWSLRLPLEKAVVGESLFCPLEPNEENDTLFSDWECPLLWKWVSSRLKIDDAFEGKPALRFNFARRTPEEVWKTNWSLWYDTALVTRERPPGDITLRATLTFEEVTTGYGSDNNSFVRPWTGIVARMVDLRRYYFFCLEYPDTIALYRREDNTWTCLARRSCDLDPFTPNTIELRLRGQWFQGFLDGGRVFAVADYAYESGQAGLRATSESFVTDFSIEADPAAVRRFSILRAKEERELAEARERVPSAEIGKTLSLPEAAPVIDMRVANFTGAGDPQIFYTIGDSPDGATGVLRDLDGNEIWRSTGPRPLGYQVTTPDDNGICNLITFSSDTLRLVDGRTGKALKERAFASLPNPPRRMGHLPDTMADLAGRGSARDFIFTAGPNDPRVWALGPELEDLWHFSAGSGTGHNSHVAVLDVDGDGREEVFAGGSLISAEGREIWRQEELLRRLKAPNAGHVDMTQMGFFCEDETIPVLHMEGSSAGHLVSDARDGSTIIDHPQGHVQGGCAARLVPGEPGIQVAASCRHGNYGILAVYSGDGRRLSRFQPDYRSDGVQPVNWDGSGIELLLIAKDPARAGLYDWRGRCLVPLTGLLPPSYLPSIPNKQRDFVMTRIGEDPRDCLILRIHHELRFLHPAGTPPARCYCPKRRSSVSLPAWTG